MGTMRLGTNFPTGSFWSNFGRCFLINEMEMWTERSNPSSLSNFILNQSELENKILVFIPFLDNQFIDKSVLISLPLAIKLHYFRCQYHLHSQKGKESVKASTVSGHFSKFFPRMNFETRGESSSVPIELRGVKINQVSRGARIFSFSSSITYSGVCIFTYQELETFGGRRSTPSRISFRFTCCVVISLRLCGAGD